MQNTQTAQTANMENPTNIKTLRVEKVTPMKSKTDGSIIGYKHKLQQKSVNSEMTAFGMVSQNKQETYYMKLDAACQVGFTADIDLNLYRIVEEEFTVEEGENAGTVMSLKHIYLKS